MFPRTFGLAVDAYLVYDGDCRVCALMKSLVKALDWRRRIRPVPLRDPEAARLLAAVDEDQRLASFHFVSDGRTASRGDGLLEILGALPMGLGIPKLAAEMPPLRRASERVYALLHGVRDALQCAV